LRPAPLLITCALTNMIAMIVLAYSEQCTNERRRSLAMVRPNDVFAPGPYQLRQISDLTILFKIV
jgi:hypothetical protein